MRFFRLFFAIACSFGTLVPGASAFAERTLVLCSQNLHRLGAPRSARGQMNQLLDRFTERRCDVIAVQEVYGRTAAETDRSIAPLLRALSAANGVTYSAVMGKIEFDQIRNAIIYRSDVVRLRRSDDLGGDLPKLVTLGRPVRFTRLPIAAEFGMRGSHRPLLVVNIHFKSKADGWKDPAGLSWEVTRMEMAEAVRRWTVERSRALGPEAIVTVMGDRNSEEGEAASEVLKGSVVLEDFKADCRVEMTGGKALPVCAKKARPFALVGLLAERDRTGSGDDDREDTESYLFRGRLIRLDEMLVEAGDLWLFRGADGSIAAGTAGRFGDGSDHKLLWSEVRFDAAMR